MTVALVLDRVTHADAMPVAGGLQIVYLDPYRGALSLGGAAGEGATLAGDFGRLRESPESRFVVRLFDQHRHLMDERAVDAGQIASTFGVDLERRVAVARAA